MRVMRRGAELHKYTDERRERLCKFQYFSDLRALVVSVGTPIHARLHNIFMNADQHDSIGWHILSYSVMFHPVQWVCSTWCPFAQVTGTRPCETPTWRLSWLKSLKLCSSHICNDVKFCPDKSPWTDSPLMRRCFRLGSLLRSTTARNFRHEGTPLKLPTTVFCKMRHTHCKICQSSAQMMYCTLPAYTCPAPCLCHFRPSLCFLYRSHDAWPTDATRSESCMAC